MLANLGSSRYQVGIPPLLQLNLLVVTHALYLGFYFNFKGSILGGLVPSLLSQSRHLPHSLFIATPLLPCGELDGTIKKFTGNDEFGDTHDHLTKAIHAFSHFTAVYTQKNIILCDLQGDDLVVFPIH